MGAAVGDVLRVRVTESQRALARFRDEERAFGLVLDVLREWRNDELFARMFRVYRSRMRHLRKVAGSLLGDLESRSAAEERRRFGRKREQDP